MSCCKNHASYVHVVAWGSYVILYVYLKGCGCNCCQADSRLYTYIRRKQKQWRKFLTTKSTASHKCHSCDCQGANHNSRSSKELASYSYRMNGTLEMLSNVSLCVKNKPTVLTAFRVTWYQLTVTVWFRAVREIDEEHGRNVHACVKLEERTIFAAQFYPACMHAMLSFSSKTQYISSIYRTLLKSNTITIS